MRPVFNVPGEGIFALLMGSISGCPIGAKTVSNLKSQGIINSIESERLIAFTNNSGPLFILGTVGVSLFHSIKIGVILLISHIISCLIVGFCFRWWKKNLEKNLYRDFTFDSSSLKVSFSNLGEILSKSVSNSINSILVVGGFVVLFSVVCSILEKSQILTLTSNIFAPLFGLFGISKEMLSSILMGIVELTNGLNSLSLFKFSNISIIIASFLLGFGGISILLQVINITSKEHISIKPYIIGKLLQGIISSIITSLILL